MDAIVGSLRPQGIDLLTQKVGERTVRAEVNAVDPLIQLLGAPSQTSDPSQLFPATGISSEELAQQILLTSLRGLLDELDEVLASLTKPTGPAKDTSGQHSRPDKGLSNSSAGTDVGQTQNEPPPQLQFPQFSSDRITSKNAPTEQSITVFSSPEPERHQAASPSGNFGAPERVAANREIGAENPVEVLLTPEPMLSLRTSPAQSSQATPDSGESKVVTPQGAPQSLKGSSVQQPIQRTSPESIPPLAPENTSNHDRVALAKAPLESAIGIQPNLKNVTDLQRLELVRDLLKALMASGAERDPAFDKGVLKALLLQLPSDLVRDLAQRSTPSTEARTPNERLAITLESPERSVPSDGAKTAIAARGVPFVPGSMPLPATKENLLADAPKPFSATLSAATHEVTPTMLRSNLTIALDPALMRALHSAVLSRPYRRLLARKYAHLRQSESSHVLLTRESGQELPSEKHDGDLHESTGLAWLRAFLVERDHASRT